MAKYAFVIGSNGSEKFGRLKYAESDADRIAKYLKSKLCGFKVIRPKKSATGDEAFKLFKDVATGCQPGDTFICYFAGHGDVLPPRGELFLVWDDKATKLVRDGVPFNNLLTYFKFCEADNKLFILDCCKAGSANVSIRDVAVNVEAVVGKIDTVATKPENQLVLAASKSFGRVREFPEYKGSFLAAKISEALSSGFKDADIDRDDRLSIDDLKEWLESEAEKHNKVFTDPDKRIDVPYFPNIGGKTKGKFYITVDLNEWTPHEIPLADKSVLVVLPICPDQYDSPEAKVLCMGKYPVTNRQYREFVKETGHPEPVGKFKVFPSDITNNAEDFITAEWHEPFYPWRDANFSADDQPVTCVSHKDALAYCQWVDSKLKGKRCFLPIPLLWEYAAFGDELPHRNWLNVSPEIHQKATAPAPIDRTGARSNKLGISDLMGNVWEWCGQGRRYYVSGYGESREPVELRGGCFHDGLMPVPIEPYLRASVLVDRENTRHFDIGFRVGGMVPFKSLPKAVQNRLLTSKQVTSYIWYTYSALSF